MNPFLVFGMILAWTICLFTFIGGYVKNDGGLIYISIIAGIVGIFSLIGCAAEWSHLHP